MKYFILNNSTYKIVASCEDTTEGAIIANSVLESMPDRNNHTCTTKLPLPETWYTDEVPEYIQLQSLDKFICLGGPTTRSLWVTARLSPAEEPGSISCAFHIRQSDHLQVTSPRSGVLTAEDVPLISVEEMPERDYTEFSGSLVYTLMGDPSERSIAIVDGQSAPTIITLSELCAALLRTEIFFGRLFNFISLNPLPGIIVDSLVHVNVTSSTLLETIQKYMVMIKERRVRLEISDALTIRHRDQLDCSTATTLSAEQYAELLQYRQALRDLPASADLDNIVWPPKPAFMA